MAHSPDGARILVVEDDPLVQRILRLQLGIRGYRVWVAADGPAGLESARRLHPDLVVLDLMMPGMSGFEVLEQLRAESELAALPVLVLTASLNDAHRRAVLGRLADAYLTKPYAEHELAATIEMLLARVTV